MLYKNNLKNPAIHKSGWTELINLPGIIFFFLSSSFKKIFKLKDNCFTMLCWFLIYNNVNQSYIYIYIPSFLNLPLSHPPHPVALGCHRAPGWAPCVTQQLSTSYHFIHGSVQMSMPGVILLLQLCRLVSSSGWYDKGSTGCNKRLSWLVNVLPKHSHFMSLFVSIKPSKPFFFLFVI